MVEPQPSKLVTRVRFPPPAPGATASGLRRLDAPRGPSPRRRTPPVSARRVDGCSVALHKPPRQAHEQAGHHERSEEHTSELQSRGHLVWRLLLEKKKGEEDSRKSAMDHCIGLATGASSWTT